MKRKADPPEPAAGASEPERATRTDAELIEHLTSEVAILEAACAARLALIESNSKVQAERQKVIDELVESNARLLSICEERGQLLETQERTIAELAAEIDTLRRTAEERLAVIDALNNAFERLPT